MADQPTIYLKVPPRAADEMNCTIFDPLHTDGLFDPEHEEYTPRLGALRDAWAEQKHFKYGTRIELTPGAAAEMLWQLASTQDIVEVAATSSYDIRDNAQAAGILQSWKAKRRKLRRWLTKEIGAEIEGGGWGSLPRVRLPEEMEP